MTPQTANPTAISLARPRRSLWSLGGVCLATLPLLGAAEFPLRPVSGFEGVWKQCYEPGLPDVVELQTGYLVLMPDGRFYELVEGCCEDLHQPVPPYWELGEWAELEDGGGIRTSYRLKLDDTVIVDVHRLLRSQRVVFWDRLEEERTADVLSWDGDINYAWCRLYPSWPVGPTPIVGEPTEARGSPASDPDQ